MGNGTNAKARKRRTECAVEQNWRCFWCGTGMISTRKGEDAHNGLPPPSNMVTLDHVFNRSDPRRQHPVKGERRYVAACYVCNQDRGRRGESGL